MLTIHRDQITAMRLANQKRYEDRVLAHLSRCLPSRVVDESTVREMIRFGIERARQYDLTSERDVCKYIDLMFVLGRDFDLKEPWLSVFRHTNDRALFDRRFDEVYDSLFENRKPRSR